MNYALQRFYTISAADDIFVSFLALEHSRDFRNFLDCCHAIWHLQLKMKDKTECSFLIYKLFVKTQNLPISLLYINF